MLEYQAPSPFFEQTESLNLEWFSDINLLTQNMPNLVDLLEANHYIRLSFLHINWWSSEIFTKEQHSITTTKYLRIPVIHFMIFHHCFR
jgi:hypothetical protein